MLDARRPHPERRDAPGLNQVATRAGTGPPLRPSSRDWPEEEHPGDQNERRCQRRKRERPQRDIESGLRDDSEDRGERGVTVVRRLGRWNVTPSATAVSTGLKPRRPGHEIAFRAEEMSDRDREDRAAEREQRGGDRAHRETREQQQRRNAARFEEHLRDR